MDAEVTIITFRDIFQYEAGKKGRYTEEYRRLSAQIILEKKDMAEIGVKDGQSVGVENEVGKIIVAAKTSDDDPHPGVAFMNSSPWSNHLVSDDVGETSIPSFKRIPARVLPSDENIIHASELVDDAG